MNSHWTYKNQIVEDIPEGVYGFVYRVVSNLSDRKYIGRKSVQSVRRKPLTKKQKESGRVRKQVIRKESDWRSYMGSCKPLLDEIKKVGKEHYKFEILAWAYTKGQLSFLEEMLQHKLNVLCDDSYYNDSIGSRRFVGVKFDEQFLNILKEIDL